MSKIILGLPKGSLNNVNRGNTYQLFIDAGYDVRGYKRRLTKVLTNTGNFLENCLEFILLMCFLEL